MQLEYCGIECQKLDWKTHKKCCAAIAARLKAEAENVREFATDTSEVNIGESGAVEGWKVSAAGESDAVKSRETPATGESGAVGSQEIAAAGESGGVESRETPATGESGAVGSQKIPAAGESGAVKSREIPDASEQQTKCEMSGTVLEENNDCS